MKQYNLYDGAGQYLGFSMSLNVDASRIYFKQHFPGLKRATIIDSNNRGYDL